MRSPARVTKSLLRLTLVSLTLLVVANTKVNAEWPCQFDDIFLNAYYGQEGCLVGERDDGVSAEWYCYWVEQGDYVWNFDPVTPGCACCLYAM